MFCYCPQVNSIFFLFHLEYQKEGGLRNLLNISKYFRVGDIFPFVTLIFEGNAQMTLKPEDYLLQQGSVVSCSLLFIYYVLEAMGILNFLMHALSRRSLFLLVFCVGRCHDLVHWLAKKPGSRCYYFGRFDLYKHSMIVI